MNRKSLTREMVEMKAAGASYANISAKVGVSRQRIQQYFSPGIKVMRQVSDRARALCEQCGSFDQFGHYHHKTYDFDILNTPENVLYLCISCHLKLNGELHYCKHCGSPIGSNVTYCSTACRKAFYITRFECTNCHKSFTLHNAEARARVSRNETGWLFCSRKCQHDYIKDNKINLRKKYGIVLV